MKITAHPVHGPADGARHVHGKHASATTTSTAPADTQAPASTPAESTVTLSARKVPPGLQRVAARLESLGAEGRSPGQSNALSQINRNLQRYIDTQALSPLPEPPTAPVLTPTPPTPPATDLTVAQPSDDPVVPTGASTSAIVDVESTTAQTLADTLPG